MAISFGVGVAMGAFWGGGGWGWGCGWGDNDIYINVNNNFNRNINRNTNIDRGTVPISAGIVVAAGNKWKHNPEHRGGTPYRDRATADRFGGSARGDSLAQRQSSAQQRIDRQGGNMASNRGSAVARQTVPAWRWRRRPRLGRQQSLHWLRLGADRIGSRDLSRSGGGNRDAFGGGSRGYSGSSARSSSSRGSSSMSSRAAEVSVVAVAAAVAEAVDADKPTDRRKESQEH